MCYYLILVHIYNILCKTRRCTNVRISDDQAIPLRWACTPICIYQQQQHQQHQEHQRIRNISASGSSLDQHISSVSTSAASMDQQHQHISTSAHQQHQCISSISASVIGIGKDICPYTSSQVISVHVH